MKKTIQVFAIIFSVITVFSCESKRDLNGDLLFGLNPTEDDGNDPQPGTKKYLKKITATDSDGEQSVMIYNYENGKLISAKLEEEGNTEDFSLTYDGDVITKLVVKEKEGSDVIISYLDLIYNNGKLTNASGKMETEGSIELMRNETSFSYNNSGIVNKIETLYKMEDIDNPGQYITTFSMTSEVLFNSNNISSWKFTTETISEPPITIPPIVLLTKFNSYDNMKNPYASFPEAFTLASTHFTTSTNSLMGLSQNNYKTAAIEVMGTSQNITINYTYDNDGYPTSATNSDGSTIKFEYTN